MLPGNSIIQVEIGKLETSQIANKILLWLQRNIHKIMELTAELRQNC